MGWVACVSILADVLWASTHLHAPSQITTIFFPERYRASVHTQAPHRCCAAAPCRAPHLVQVQLGDVFKTVVYSDYPEKWPGLLEALCSNLVNPDTNRVHGALFALRILMRKYEFRDEEERVPLAQLVHTTFPVSHPCNGPEGNSA